LKDLSGTIKINFKNNLFKSIKNIFSKNPFHKCKKEKYIPERPLQKYIFYLWKGCSRSNKKMYLQKDPSKSVKKMYFGKVFSEQGQVLYLAFLFDFVNTFFFLCESQQRWWWVVAAAVFGLTVVFSGGWTCLGEAEVFVYVQVFLRGAGRNCQNCILGYYNYGSI